MSWRTPDTYHECRYQAGDRHLTSTNPGTTSDLAEALALVTLGKTARSPYLVFGEDALPVRAVVVIVVDVAMARLAAFGCDRVVGRHLDHAGSLFVDGSSCNARR